MHDLQARLDRAITEARLWVLNACGGYADENRYKGNAELETVKAWSVFTDRLDHFAALVALRARINALSALFGDTGPYAQGREAGRLLNEATAEAERLLGSGEDA